MAASRRTRGVLCVSLTLLSFAGAVRGQSTSPQRDDTQIWNDTQLAIALDKKVDFVLFGTLRIGRNIRRPVDERIGVGFSFKVGKYLTLYPNYLYRGGQPLPNRTEFEHRLSFAATIRGPVGHGFILSDRNLLERRIRRPQVDATRYRNRLQIEHPFKIGATKLNAFISDEIFYDWSVNAWVRNRFAIGVGHTFDKDFTGEVYYLRQNDSRTRPGDLNVIGTTLRFRLK
jgi:hypothetical protein